MENIDSKYRDQYKDMHRKQMFNAWKKNYDPHLITNVRARVLETKSETLLDFGSGRGEQYSEGKIYRNFRIKESNITCYDLGVKEFEVLPEKMFDGIISTDVFEHIPEDELPAVIKYITSHAKNFVYIVIFCGEARKKFPDGTNVHVTIKHPSWWYEIVKKNNISGVPVYLDYKWPQDPLLNKLKL